MAKKLHAATRGRPAENFALLDKIRNFLQVIIVCQLPPCVRSEPRGVMLQSLVPFCSAFTVNERRFLFGDLFRCFEVPGFQLTAVGEI